MSVTAHPIDLRNHTRFQITDAPPIPVSVGWTTNEECHECNASLADLSASGARLYLTEKVPLHETIEVRMRLKKLDIDFHCAAEVCRLQPAGPDWVLGCAFDCELPARLLSELASNGYLNRRSDTRVYDSFAAEMKEELGGSQWFEITVDNYSSGGFRLQTNCPVSIGRRVLLKVEGSDRPQVVVPGRVLWRADVDDGFAVGCSFLNGDGFAKLTQVVNPETVKTVKNQRRSIRLSPLAWLALVAIVALSQHDALTASLHWIWRLLR